MVHLFFSVLKLFSTTNVGQVNLNSIENIYPCNNVYVDPIQTSDKNKQFFLLKLFEFLYI